MPAPSQILLAEALLVFGIVATVLALIVLFVSRRRRRRLALLGIAGVSCVLLAAALVNEDEEADLEALHTEFFRPAVRPSQSTAWTDTGRPIRLLEALPEQEAGTASAEAVLLQRRTGPRAIRLGVADPRFNCHGWVFTGGQYWVLEQDVESIIEDNGYRLVETPEPNDLVVYRDLTNRPLHTGLARGAVDLGGVLVESK